ncbi:hypothetical protein D3C80_1152170 [compost metagenome]
MMRGILQHHPEIFEMEGVAQRAFDADIGGDADEHQIADAAGTQHAVHIGVEETAVTCLRHQNIAGLRLQLIDDGIVPRSLGQQLALQFRPFAHRLQRIGLVPVGRARPARLDIILVPAVLEIDDLNTRRPRRIQRLLDVGDSALGSGNIEPGKVDITAFGRIGVLHVDHDNGGLAGLQGNRLRPCGKRHAFRTAFRPLVTRHDGFAHSAASSSARTCLRLFISGCTYLPNFSTPSRKSSKVSITPPVPGTSLISSSMAATSS